jgi:hypothetical protein
VVCVPAVLDTVGSVVEVNEGTDAGIVAVAVVNTGVDTTGELSVVGEVVDAVEVNITSGVDVVVGSEGFAISVKMVK